jgi:Protein of unknown function (DUF2892)
MFRHNVGGVDRVLRLTLGGIFFLAGLFLLTSSIRPGVVLAVIGVLALLTGIFRFCALYAPFGISTATPGKPLRNQACDCAVWMKKMQDNRIAVAAQPSPKEESVEATTETHAR